MPFTSPCFLLFLAGVYKIWRGEPCHGAIDGRHPAVGADP